MFIGKLGLEEAWSLCDLLNKAQPNINYEEKLLTEEPKREKPWDWLGFKEEKIIVMEMTGCDDPDSGFPYTLI